MWLTDKEQKDLLDEEPGPSTNRIARAVTVALQSFGMGRIPTDLEKIWKLAEKIDSRIEETTKAEVHAAKAYANTLGTETGLSKE